MRGSGQKTERCANETVKQDDLTDNSGDVVIKGVISQRESGFLTDRKTDTIISFTVYGKSGKVLGEGFYHDNESAGEESVRRSAADKFVSELIKNLGRVD